MSVALTAAAPGLIEPPLRTVLIVDHRESIRRVLTLILEAEGVRGIATPDPALAVTIAREVIPDAVTLDLGRADADDVRVLRSIKADPLLKHVPLVVLVTCRAARAVAEEHGATAILTTPVDLDDLLARIHSVTG